jgi:acetoin utilization deacetylase AcuC-like enzyme
MGCERVAIWEHHGNATEAIVSRNNRIRFASVHQYPAYLGTGAVSYGNVFNGPIHTQKLDEIDPSLSSGISHHHCEF